MNPLPLQVLCCLLIGYLLGCFSPSYLIGRKRGYDVRKSGSGNAGASNTVILAGKLAGFAVAVTDILKAAAAWWLCRKLFPLLRLAGMLGGVAALLGHMFPAFLHFRGGRGLACLGGLALAYDWRVLLLMLAIALVIGLTTDYVCVATVSMSLIFPLYVGITSGQWDVAAVLTIPALPILLRHLENFRRIRQGKELRLSFLWNREAELKRIGRSQE